MGIGDRGVLGDPRWNLADRFWFFAALSFILIHIRASSLIETAGW